MGATQSLLIALALLAPQRDEREAVAAGPAESERYRAITQAFARAEFAAAERFATELATDGGDTVVARKAAALRDTARFLGGSASVPNAAPATPVANGVTAEAGALRLALASDLAFGAAAIGVRGMRPLLFGYPAPFTSRLTVSVDGETFAPSRAAALSAGPGIVEGRITERGVEVLVRLHAISGGAPPSWHPAAEQASLRVEAIVTNRSDRPRRIGARLLLDVTDGFEDAPAARIGPSEAMPFAVDWIGDAVPRRVSLGATSVVMRGIRAAAPERVLLVPLALAAEHPFDFALGRDVPLGADSAFALYAEPIVLAPGESRTLAAEITPDGDDLDSERPVGTALFQEPVAGDPDATRVLLALRAGTRGTIGETFDVSVRPSVAAGLATIESAPDLGAIGTLARGVTLQRSIVVRPDLTRGGALEVAFDIAGDVDGRGVGGTASRRVATGIAAPGSTFVAGRILDPGGRPVPATEVALRQNGREIARGSSDGAGNYRFDGVPPGPCEVWARRSVFAEPAAKAAHEDVENILFEVQLLSETIDDAGAHRLPVVLPGAGRDVVLARSLTRYSLLVGVEWDADREYLEGVARGMRRAAEFLYAASDGHFTFGRIAIHDCGRDWNSCDLWDWANNSVHPNATVAGIRHRYHPVYVPWNTGINFGRQWDSAWDHLGLYGTVVHEFGHYGFGLYDEYLGAPQGIYRGLSYPEMCRCIMGYQYSDYKICFAANHRTYTNQGMFNGRSCWEQLEANHEGDRGGFFASVTTPAERGGRTPPPVTNHIGDEVRVVIRDDSTAGRNARLEVAGPFDRAPSGIPVYVECPHDGRTVYHGITLGDGALQLMGIHAEDRVSATFAGARAELRLDERPGDYRLEFGSEPREGAVPPLVSFHPEIARGEFAGGVLEIRTARAAVSDVTVVAYRPQRTELPVREIETSPAGTIRRRAAAVPAASFEVGRGAFDIVESDPLAGDATTLVDVVIGRGEVAAFDGSVEVDARDDPAVVPLSIASTAGSPFIAGEFESVGRLHAVTAAGDAAVEAVFLLRLPEGLVANAGDVEPLPRLLDPATGEFHELPNAELVPDGGIRALLRLPATVAFVRRTR